MADVYFDLNKEVVNNADRIFSETSLANNGNTDSDIFRVAQVGARAEIVVVAETEITIADTKSLTVTLFYDSSRLGDFSTSRVIKAIAASGSALTIAQGAEICRYTPDSGVEHFGKLRITSTGDQSADKVTANLSWNVD